MFHKKENSLMGVFGIVTKPLLAFSLMSTLLFSCKKDKDPVPDPTPTAETVYVAGASDKEIVIWKNGIRSSYAKIDYKLAISSLFVDGTNIYITGNEYNDISLVSKPKLWKNGVEISIPSMATEVHTSNIYAKDGIVYVLFREINYDYINGISLSKNLLWKDGVISTISEAKDTLVSEAVFLSNGKDLSIFYNTYPLPYIGTVPKYWTGGKFGSLPLNSVSVSGGGLFKTASDMHEVGNGLEINPDSSKNVNTLLHTKNGITTELERSTSFKALTSVFVKESDVYITGFETLSDGKNVATLWKNGVKTKLSTESENYKAGAVFVK